MPCEFCDHCRQVAHKVEAADADAALATIIGRVSEEFHVETFRLLGAQRSRNLAWARQVAFYLARETTTLSFPAIGKYFNRDHSTIIHGCNAVRERMAERPMFASEVRKLISA